METNRKSYNKVSSKWNEARSNMPINKCIADFTDTLIPNGKILDLGCGTGSPIAKYLDEKGFVITGIDMSEELLKDAKKLNLRNAKFILCDFFDFETREQYDGIIAFDSLFHFPKDKQKEIYPRLSALLNIGGRLLFTHGKRDGELKDKMFGKEFYYSSLNTEELKKVLIDNSFVIETFIEDYSEATTGQRDLLVVARKVK